MDGGRGVAAWPFNVRDLNATEWSVGVSADVASVMTHVGGRISHDIAAQFLLGSRTKTACERIQRTTPLDEDPSFNDFQPFRIRDFAALTLLDPSGHGLAFAAPLEAVRASTRTSSARLERAGAHVLAAFRLRRALTIADDAVLEPNGRVVHAEGEARGQDQRDVLREAVKRLDQARGKRACRDPDQALDSWRALISGQWSLVESFESDGRRYLIARRNPPGSVGAAAVSSLESSALLRRAQGASHKLIAYELGVSCAAAHRLVTSGARKLGIPHDGYLPVLFGVANA
jgi:hypothetical protein